MGTHTEETREYLALRRSGTWLRALLPGHCANSTAHFRDNNSSSYGGNQSGDSYGGRDSCVGVHVATSETRLNSFARRSNTGSFSGNDNNAGGNSSYGRDSS